MPIDYMYTFVTLFPLWLIFLFLNAAVILPQTIDSKVNLGFTDFSLSYYNFQHIKLYLLFTFK